MIDTTPEVARRPKSSYHPNKISPLVNGSDQSRDIIDYQYANPAFSRGPTDHSGKSSPIILGTKVLPNSHLEPTYVGVKTAKHIKQDLQPDGYTSIAMDARIFAPSSHPLAGRAHSPPQRDSAENVDTHSSNITGSKKRTNSNNPPGHGGSSQIGVEEAKLAHRGPSHEGWASERGSHPRHDINGETGETPKKNIRPGALLEDGDDELDIVEKIIQPGMTPEPLVKSIRQELNRLAQKGTSDDHIA